MYMYISRTIKWVVARLCGTFLCVETFHFVVVFKRAWFNERQKIMRRKYTKEQSRVDNLREAFPKTWVPSNANFFKSIFGFQSIAELF